MITKKRHTFDSARMATLIFTTVIHMEISTKNQNTFTFPEGRREKKTLLDRREVKNLADFELIHSTRGLKFHSGIETPKH